MRRLTLAVVLALLSAASSALAAPAAIRTVTLVETRPIETALGDSTLPSTQLEWVAMIDGAKKTLDLEEFYLSEQPGEALSPVLDAIGRAAKRGVRVRLLLDAGMHRTYPMPADSLGRLSNVTVRTIDYRRIAGGVQHAKYFVVDGQESFIGSQNLDWRSLSHIHELGTRIRDRSVGTALSGVFETDWTVAADSNATTPTLVHGVSFPLAFSQDGAAGKLWISASPPKMTPTAIPHDLDVVVERLRAARREICIQTLTYGNSGFGVTDSTLHKELIRATTRGVRVRLLVSDWEIGGRGEKDLRALAAVPNIEMRISRVPEWSGGYIAFARVEHCKFLVVDGEWLWIGTSNWEPSYFLGARNVAITVQHKPLALEGMKVFESDWNGPTATAFGPETVLAPRPHGEQH
jgi:phosphatidylserine/phosphatidylglycerophosphate/cardiolipin synthase-like enzyme